MNSSSLPTWFSFSFPHEEIEQTVSESEDAYKGHSEAALYTSEEDFLRIFNHPLVSGTFVDFGCGTGLGCLLYGLLYPERKAIGFEREESRLRVGKNLVEHHDILNVEFVHGDLLTDILPHGDCYFLYFPTGPVFDRIITTLYERKRFFRLVVIESHGDLLERLARENWLSEVASIPLVSRRHHPFAKIFEPNGHARSDDLLPFNLSYQEKFLVIEENGEQWVGETSGLAWHGDHLFTLKQPPRTINWGSVKKLMDFSDLSGKLLLAIRLRREGLVEIKTDAKTYSGEIRKIITSPVFNLEISSGERIEWGDILSIKKDSKLCYDSSSPSL